jgi:Adenylate and Guanylate cyclase catalytic domain
MQTLTPDKIIERLIDTHHGRFVNSAGDSVMAELTSVVEAVNCAVEIQTVLKAELNLQPQCRMEFRIGVNSGDVIVQGEQIYGDGVNVAARLESLADPGGICISRCWWTTRKRSESSFADRGSNSCHVRAWNSGTRGVIVFNWSSTAMSSSQRSAPCLAVCAAQT